MNNSKHIVFNTLMTVICFLFIVTMSVTLILYLKPLYYMMVRILDVPAMSGYSYEVCKTNYDILIGVPSRWNSAISSCPSPAAFILKRLSGFL